MDHNRIVTIFGMVFCWFVLVGSAYCDSTFKELTHRNVIQDEGNSTIATNSNGLHYLDINAFRVTSDFILRLNELIKSLAMFALDGSLDTRTALNMAQDEWNRTERILADLLETTQGNNATVGTLRESLDTIRLEKIKLISLGRVLDRRISTTEMDETNAVVEELPLSLILHPSIAGLTQVSADLLRSLDHSGGKQFRQHPRSTVTAPSVEEFNSGFRRKFRETKRIFVAEIKQMLRRIKARLSVLPDSEELTHYVDKITETIKTFLHDTIVHLTMASKDVTGVMGDAAIMVDHNLSIGLSHLFQKATKAGHFNFLELCLTRYVYKYYDQSQALAKLLYCGQPELATLEYLVTVAAPILERAVITDSSVVQMAVICSPGSTSCMDEFKTSLDLQASCVQERYDAFFHLIQLELDSMFARVTVCSHATALEIETFGTNTKKNFKSCLGNGKIN